VGIPERLGPVEWRIWKWGWPFKTFEITISPGEPNLRDHSSRR
jgi:hypothetical protein